MSESAPIDRMPIHTTRMSLQIVKFLAPICMAALAVICLLIFIKSRPATITHNNNLNVDKPLAPLTSLETSINDNTLNVESRVNNPRSNLPTNSANELAPSSEQLGSNSPGNISDTAMAAQTAHSTGTPARQLWDALGSSLERQTIQTRENPTSHQSQDSLLAKSTVYDQTGRVVQLSPQRLSSTTGLTIADYTREPVLFRANTAPISAPLENKLNQVINGALTKPSSALNRDIPKTLAHSEPSLSLLLPRGSKIDCTLETAIDSTLPGLTSCVVATDVYSADGLLVLLERGSLLVGETHADVKANQARVGVIWTDARTAQGVRLKLESPATDALGRTGLTGEVDRHTKTRLEAAALLTLLDTAVNTLQARVQRNASINVNPQTSSSVASEALRDTLQSVAVIRVPPGAMVSILAVQDIDFSAVYTVTAQAKDAP